MTNLTQPNLFQLLFSGVALQLNSLIFKSPKLPPSKFGNYTLVRQIPKSDKFSNMSICIYKKNSKKYFVKLWLGGLRDLNYNFLVNEYLTNQHLIQVFSKASFSIPKSVECILGSFGAAFVYEFIDNGTPLDNFPTTYQAKIVASVINKINSIKISHEESAKPLTIRPGWFYLLLLPFITLLTIIHDFKNAMLYFKTFTACLKDYATLDLNNFYLSHRDLTPNNILIKNHRVYLVDGESFVYTAKGYDISFLSNQPNCSAVYKTLKDKYALRAQPFFEKYIALHHTLGSGAFLKINASKPAHLNNLLQSK